MNKRILKTLIAVLAMAQLSVWALSPQIIVTPNSLSVNEGGTAQVIVSLSDYLGPDVPITLTAAGTDTDLTVSPMSFTLSSGNPQETLTVSAAEDADKLAGMETFTLSSAGLSNALLSVTEYDNDVIRVIATPAVTLEGNTNAQGAIVQLSIDPGGPLTLTITRTSGDTDLTCTGSITLDSSNYNQPGNDLAITAAEDDSDTADDSAVFTITGADENATFTATALDDDIVLTVNRRGDGSVTGEGIHDLDDAPFPITAIPRLGERFIRWSGPDADKVVDTSKELTAIVAIDDATVTAEFTEDDDDSGCNLAGGTTSLLPLIMLIAAMLGLRFKRS